MWISWNRIIIINISWKCDTVNKEPTKSEGFNYTQSFTEIDFG